MMRNMRMIFWGCLLVVWAATVFSEPRPGDVFREYKWRPDGKWQRVTGADSPEQAKQFLPNKINTIDIDDMVGATKVEVYIEMLLCHGGTIEKQIRINKNPWITIAESPSIPGDAGTGPPASEYQYMRYPTVEVPLNRIHAGTNTFEFTCNNGTALGGWWPQWILYGVTFRVYYDSSKPHATGEIISPSAGSILGENPTFEVNIKGNQSIQRIDLIGTYEDFNWEGDGNYTQWHYRYAFGAIHNHIGSATHAPYRIRWDNRWIPTQRHPIKVMARIVDETNLCTMTQPVENLRLSRPYRVRMYKPYDIPKLWSTRMNKTQFCHADIEDDLNKALDAKIILCTWNGVAADVLGINGTKVAEKIGKNHDLSYDDFPVPLQVLKQGQNTLSTFSSTEHHGCEVQWPGPVLFVRYDQPENG